MAKKTFSVGSQRTEPLTFDLQGTDTKGNPIEPIEFECLPDVQGEVLTEMVASVRNGDGMVMATKVPEFIKSCMAEGEAERFDQITHSKNIVVQVELLAQIMTWLMEEYTQRPTQASSGLSIGQSKTTPTSTDAATSQGSNIQNGSVPDAFATPFTPAL